MVYFNSTPTYIDDIFKFNDINESNNNLCEYYRLTTKKISCPSRPKIIFLFSYHVCSLLVHTLCAAMNKASIIYRKCIHLNLMASQSDLNGNLKQMQKHSESLKWCGIAIFNCQYAIKCLRHNLLYKCLNELLTYSLNREEERYKPNLVSRVRDYLIFSIFFILRHLPDEEVIQFGKELASFIQPITREGLFYKLSQCLVSQIFREDLKDETKETIHRIARDLIKQYYQLRPYQKVLQTTQYIYPQKFVKKADLEENQRIALEPSSFSSLPVSTTLVSMQTQQRLLLEQLKAIENFERHGGKELKNRKESIKIN